MKRILCTVLTLLLILSIFPAATLAASETPKATASVTATAKAASTLKGTVVNCKSNVNVRSGPGTNYKLLGSAKKGAVYTVTKQNYKKGWHQISFNGKTGYISSQYLSVKKAPATTPKPTPTPTPKPTETPVVNKNATVKIQSAVSAGKTAIQLKWSGVTGAAYYEVYCKAPGSSKYTKVSSGKYKDRIFYQGNLTKGKTYAYTVRAVFSDGSKTALAAAKKVTPSSNKLGKVPFKVVAEKGTYALCIMGLNSKGSYTIPVKVFRFAYGKGRQTPTGSFKLGKKVRWHQFGGGGWSQYSTFFYGNLLIHSPLYKSPNAKTMYPDYYNGIWGTGSHRYTSGCIRTTTEGSYFIYNNCDPGTYIQIVAGGTHTPPKKTPLKNSRIDPTDAFV